MHSFDDFYTLLIMDDTQKSDGDSYFEKWKKGAQMSFVLQS